MRIVLAIGLLLVVSLGVRAQEKRARDLGIQLDGTPGYFNAITDVKGVEVGNTTLISGEGKLVVGKGPVRTGVTAGNSEKVQQNTITGIFNIGTQIFALRAAVDTFILSSSTP